MRILREAFTGIAAALITSLLVMGAIVLAITEGMVLPTPEPTAEVKTPDPMETMLITFTIPTPRPKPPLVAAPTQPVAPPCHFPPGWETYTFLPGDNLKDLAKANQITVDELVQANCLEGISVPAGSTLYLPPLPTPTPTSTTTSLPPTATSILTANRTVCSPPAGWVRYIVRSGDTLFKIATLYGTTWQNLQKFNCMSSPLLIYPGNVIYVPNVAPRYTATGMPFYPSATPRPSPTRTSTLRPTFTFTPIATLLTPTHTFTPLPTHTSTSTPTATSTSTPTATSTSTPTSTPTATSTSTPTPTATPTPTPTDTSTPTGTNTPTDTSTPTATMTATNTTNGT